jgi:hypothetical protein
VLLEFHGSCLDSTHFMIPPPRIRVMQWPIRLQRRICHRIGRKHTPGKSVDKRQRILEHAEQFGLHAVRLC